MSDTMLDDYPMEYWGWGGGDAEAEDDGEAEDLYDAEGEDLYDAEAESAASKKRARRRKAQAAMARRKLAMARTRGRRPVPARTAPKTPTAAIRRTQAAVSNLNLETKVQTDTIQTQLKNLDKRTKGNTQALVAIPALAQFSAQIDDFVPGLSEDTKNILNGLLRFGHVAFLKSSGQGALASPQVQAAALGGAVVGLGALARRINDDNNGDNGDGGNGDNGNGGGGGGGHPGGGPGYLMITDYRDQLPVEGQHRFRASVAEGVTWASDKPTIAEVDSYGLVVAKKAGTANIKASTADDFTVQTVTVVPAPAGK
jgi:hypothetical protein